MTNSPNPKLSPEKYARLKAEAQAPYKGLRKFIYLGSAIPNSNGINKNRMVFAFRGL